MCFVCGHARQTLETPRLTRQSCGRAEAHCHLRASLAPAAHFHVGRHEAPHTKIARVIVVLGFVSSTQLAHSADADGRFWLGDGTGGVACPQFVAALEKARSLGIGSVGYAGETQGFTMYLLGFRTGYNMSTQQTCDISPDGEKDYPLLSWLENFCRANPSGRFADAVVALARESHPKRQKVCQK